MMKIRLFGALIASAALAACGGGGEDAGETADAAAGADTAVQETAAEETSSAAEEVEATAADAADAMEGAADDAAGAIEAAGEQAADAMEGAAQDAAEAVQDAAADTSADAAFTIAGLTGDVEAGRRVFARCRSCHVLDEGVNRVGPSLYGIIGREAGTVEGFRYSEANQTSGVTWTEQNLFDYLENPREYIPGTIMAFPGLRDAQDRADVIAYIKANGGDAS